ncbi:hypothetical protein GQS52_04090 [Streptomyces sp. SCUT-3]|uniref:DUF6571 family protein n=1 Tax=Streptomyces sp. SCUT-3 TaxID=2684469 RepID=UPI000CC34A63|nr:DUF6571 family protein [Streptomyces sp. SCUT-3]PLW73391.1 hypothetical protein C0036_07490 [Streptomyces sp. DJ]QMV21086.1 hypothetical protein GQS52_04090 [Streptomyces sp. SCUT-3]
MPDYEQLYHLNIGALKAAAESWGEMARKLKSLDHAMDNEVVKPFQAAGWTSADRTSDHAASLIKTTGKEFSDAATEAKAIADILDEAHSTLKKCKEDLHELAGPEAKKNLLHVSGTGIVRYQEGKSVADNPDAPLDHYYSTALAMEQENIDKFVNRINKVLARAQEADETASWALKRNVGSKKDDFNSRVHSTFDSADAGRALQLAQKGKEMSDKDLKEFNGLLKANRNDKEFAEKFAVGMGGRGTLEFWSEMADPRLELYGTSAPDEKRTVLLEELQKNLGTTLATATHGDSVAMKAWEKEVIGLGNQRLGTEHAANPYGFQVMSNLMRHGKYDTDFLSEYGKELVKVDKSFTGGVTPGHHWITMSHSDLNFGDENDRGNDPMTGFMEALGHNPEAATEFFYSKEGVEGEKSNLDYLLKERDWPHDNILGAKSEGKSGHNSLGHALEAAVTGHPYDRPPNGSTPPHSAERAAVMEDVVSLVSKDPEKAHAGMADSLGRMAAEYMPDIHHALVGGGSEMENLYPHGESTGAHFNSSDITRFLYEVGKDPDGYAAVNYGQHIYTSEIINYHFSNPDSYGRSTEDTLREVAAGGGQIEGIIGEARRNAVVEGAIESDKEFNDSLASGGEWAKAAIGIGIGVGVAGATSPVGGVVAGDSAKAISGAIIDGIIEGFEKDTKDGAVYRSGLDKSEAEESTTSVIRNAAAKADEENPSGMSRADLEALVRDGVKDGIGQANDRIKDNLPTGGESGE